MNSRILFLGPEESPLYLWLQARNESVIRSMDRISVEFLEQKRIYMIVSYGYRFIIRQDIIDAVNGNVVNLHISYLPWNRGADPNFWSFINDTPKGVTIHFVDAGVDTGDIIVQKKVVFPASCNTLKTTYEYLQTEIQQLFKDNWDAIKSGKAARQVQQSEIAANRSADKDHLLHLLTDGWDTPVKLLEEYGKQLRVEKGA